MAVRVKICGITSLADALAASEAGADAVGFNFCSRSPRYVSPKSAAEIVAVLPKALCTVGVFVNESRAKVARIAADLQLRVLQFHGDESPEFCRKWPIPVIKALRVRDRAWQECAREYTVDWILVDAFVEGTRGGTGRVLDADLLEGADADRLVLAGGLTADNVSTAVRRVRPFGVDVASGVETGPGRKDPKLMRSFVENAKSA